MCIHPNPVYPVISVPLFVQLPPTVLHQILPLGTFLYLQRSDKKKLPRAKEVSHEEYGIARRTPVS